MHDAPRGCFEPIARERWAEHPRFRTQTLLLGSHESFREISRSLVGGELASASVVARQSLFDRWQASMRSHEHYEERKLYPFLRRRFGVTTSALEEGHAALHAIEVVLRAAAAARDEGAWASAMARYDEVLHAHLHAEEELVIPCLLALAPAEFRSYYDASAATAAETPACC